MNVLVQVNHRIGDYRWDEWINVPPTLAKVMQSSTNGRVKPLQDYRDAMKGAGPKSCFLIGNRYSDAERLIFAAYGQVYRVRMVDDDGHPLVKSLPKEARPLLSLLIQDIRDYHGDRPAWSQRVHALVTNSNAWLTVGFVALMSALYVLAFDWRSQVDFIIRAATYPARHWDDIRGRLPDLIRIEARLFFFIVPILFAWLKGWLNWIPGALVELSDWWGASAREAEERRLAAERAQAAAAAAAAAAAERRGRYGPYAIDDFTEKSPFGDASHAQKGRLVRAMLGANGGFQPKFED